MTAEARLQHDFLFYVVAALFGVFAGRIDLKFGDLVFTALLVVAPCMLLGALRPERPWRWVLLVAGWVPVAELLGYVVMTQSRIGPRFTNPFSRFCRASRARMEERCCAAC